MNERVEVRMFGLLQAWCREQGEPCETAIDVASEGETARAVAGRLGLPLERIEGVFCNHVVHGLGHVVMPGDRIAFVPKGTPGPHRYFLGLYEAGKEEES